MDHTTWSDYNSCQKEEVSDLSNVPVAILMNKQNPLRFWSSNNSLRFKFVASWLYPCLSCSRFKIMHCSSTSSSACNVLDYVTKYPKCV